MKTLFYDFDADRRINGLGVAQTTAQKIVYQSKDWLKISVRHNAAGTLTPVDLSEATAWRAAVDVDYNRCTDPCCRVLDASIDASAAAAGDISFPLDANTATFLSAVEGKASVATPTTKLELVGLDSAGAQIFYFAIPVELLNTLDPTGGDPPEPAGNYYNKTEVDALVNGLRLVSSPFSKTFTSAISDDELSWEGDLAIIAHGKATGVPAVALVVNGYVSGLLVAIVDNNTVSVDFSGLPNGKADIVSATINVRA